MSDKVGVLRRGDDLRAALTDLNALTSELRFGTLGEAEYEFLNLLKLVAFSQPRYCCKLAVQRAKSIPPSVIPISAPNHRQISF
jgi:hypothetical protein